MNNQHGVDADYFSRKLKLVSASINNYTPQELARELYRLAITSCEAAVVEEVEFKRDNGYTRVSAHKLGELK